MKLNDFLVNLAILLANGWIIYPGGGGEFAINLRKNYKSRGFLAGGGMVILEELTMHYSLI